MDNPKYRISAKEFEKFFEQEASAIDEAKKESLKSENKNVVFLIHEISPAVQVIIGSVENGNFSPGVDLGEINIQ